jgi:polysaccharide pyruvyl transferase WcaK-like protein
VNIFDAHHSGMFPSWHPMVDFATEDRTQRVLKMEADTCARPAVALFGHFGTDNFGNESTLKAILYHLHRVFPAAAVTCVCSDPEAAVKTHNIAAVPISGIVAERLILSNPPGRLARKVCIGMPSELYRWLKAFMVLRDKDMLIVPGTGLLTDAYGLSRWGPYNVFKWSLIAKLCCCKLAFVSVGVGPIYSGLGKWLVKSALWLADFRSYRDEASLQYVRRIGFAVNTDRVYPDLVFSLPKAIIPSDTKRAPRRVVGVGLMEYAGKYSTEKPNNAVYRAYLDALVIFVRWLLDHDYDVRLLVGDLRDVAVTQEFKFLLAECPWMEDEGRVIDEPPVSVEQLLSQLATTDIVVATRFHNVLLALLLNKPVIAISFHHKCVSLMSQMGLSEYCQDINHLDAGRLIEQFCDSEKNRDKLRVLINHRMEACRTALDEQYNCIFSSM